MGYPLTATLPIAHRTRILSCLALFGDLGSVPFVGTIMLLCDDQKAKFYYKLPYQTDYIHIFSANGDALTVAAILYVHFISSIKCTIKKCWTKKRWGGARAQHTKQLESLQLL